MILCYKSSMKKDGIIVGRTRKVFKRKYITFGMIGCVITIIFVGGVFFYPLYVRYVAGNYAKEFAVVLNSHDMKKYDAFFNEDTVFRYGDKEITYADARKHISQIREFESKDSYGHLDENTNVFAEKEYEVSLMLPVRVNNGEFNGILEGWLVLKRKCIFLSEIKEVGVYKNTLSITKEQ